MGLEAGLKGVATTAVTDRVTALSMGSGSLPVFATPAMVALMEAAACDALAKHLESTDTTVGTAMNISHLAATPLNLNVRAEATLEKVEGRKLSFKVIAFDDKEKIGEGTHERVVVGAARFEQKAYAKTNAALQSKV
eukprot:GFYU01013863.1.p1 GENE.GFYU01013863.1~~GFYU01013863.1.p1  ORF type:complete len:137 (-),score=35.70 GFYU01013863.1:338-748(-)